MGCQCTDPRLYTNSVQPGVSTSRAPQALTLLNITGAKSNSGTGTNALVLKAKKKKKKKKPVLYPQKYGTLMHRVLD